MKKSYFLVESVAAGLAAESVAGFAADAESVVGAGACTAGVLSVAGVSPLPLLLQAANAPATMRTIKSFFMFFFLIFV